MVNSKIPPLFTTEPLGLTVAVNVSGFSTKSVYERVSVTPYLSTATHESSYGCVRVGVNVIESPIR